MDRQRQRLYYNLCNPDVALPPEDRRNVDLDSFGDRDHPVRGLNWLHQLADSIEFSVADAAVEKPACEFFTGLPGSGKTTEILRLKQRLQQRDGANLLVVYIDGEEFIDTTDRLDVSDLHIAMLCAIERRVLEAEGKDAQAAMGEGVLDRVAQLLSKLSISNPKVGLPGGASLAVEMRMEPSLRQEVRRRVAEHTTTFVRQSKLEMRQLRERALRCGYSGVVVLFDSLEKLRGTSERFAEVLISAENLFSQGAPYLRVPVHVVYTIPPALILRLRVRIRFMPMIKLWERNRSPYPPGLAAARAIIDQRIPERDVLTWCFGAENEAMLEDRLRRLIEWSAGYPREIIFLLRSALLQAPLSEIGFERLLGTAGDDYRRLLLASDLPLLAQVAFSHKLRPQDDGQRRAADRMFSNNVVLRYHNSTEWYDVHPAVRDMPDLAEEMRRLAKAEEQAG